MLKHRGPETDWNSRSDEAKGRTTSVSLREGLTEGKRERDAEHDRFLVARSLVLPNVNSGLGVLLSSFCSVISISPHLSVTSASSLTNLR